MAIPGFSTLLQNYPRESREDLYRSVGWDSLIGNPDYENTCAIRMSICLLRSAVPITRGELTIWKGPLKSKQVRIRYNQLADDLKGKWGAPTVLKKAKAAEVEKLGDGVIAFHGLPSGYPGHIDLIDVSKTSIQFLWWTYESTSSACPSGCYFESREIWHWAA